MSGLGVVLVVAIALGIGRLVYISSGSEPSTVEPAPTEAELLQARLDLLRIERGVDISLAREEARREGLRTKEAIAEALENGP